MNYFVGVVPQQLNENPRLRQICSKLKKTVSQWEDPVRWTPPSIWHVTLLFLGKRTPEELVKIQHVMNNLVLPESFNISFSGLGAFPSNEEGRVLWVGVRENKAFLQVQNYVEQQFLAEGLVSTSEQEYRPHLTLGRFRHLRNLQSLIALGSRTDFGSDTISEVALFESVLEGNIPKIRKVGGK